MTTTTDRQQTIEDLEAAQAQIATAIELIDNEPRNAAGWMDAAARYLDRAERLVISNANRDDAAAAAEAAAGCSFHGSDSGHSDPDCPATDVEPAINNAFCPHRDVDEKYFVRQVTGRIYHGWYHADLECMRITQSG